MTARRVRRYTKYVNRKFYDVEEGRYASVSDIAGVVKGGEDISVACDRTGRDVTRETLARILYEEVKSRGVPGRWGGAAALQVIPVTSSQLTKLIRLFSPT